MSNLIRILVLGSFVLVAACGGEPGVEELCGSCPEGPLLDSCEELYSACSVVRPRSARNLCFDQLDATCLDFLE